MKAKGYFRLLTSVMIAASIFIAYTIVLQGFSWYFIVAEIFILLVILLLFVLYVRVVKPMQTIGDGMNLLREQDFSSRLGYVGQKDADKVVEIFNKMMSQLKDERLHIREQNQFLDLLVTSSPMGLIIMDFDEKVTSINPAVGKLMCAPAEMFEGKTLPEIALFSGSSSVAGQISTALYGIENGHSSLVRTNDGNAYKCSAAYFLDRGFQRKFYLIEQMTEEMLKAETKAYGKVIRMISHEVNNSMAGVTSSLNTACDILCDVGKTLQIEASEINDISQMLSVSSERCLGLSRFISSFTEVIKIPEPQFERVRLNDFINNRLRFFESLCSSKNITFETHLSPSAGTVTIDPVLMEQVMVNIIKNGSEAIDTNGIISISTIAPTQAPDGRVTLIIANNGHGIDSDVADKLFTPFFSTKINGQGIGLTLIRDILLKHHFRFSLRTAQDGWTRFSIEMESITLI